MSHSRSDSPPDSTIYLAYDARLALIVINLRKEINHPSGPPEWDTTTTATHRLLAAAYFSNVPVFFVETQYDDGPNNLDYRPFKLSSLISKIKQLLSEKHDSRFHRGFGDTVVMKKSSSSFLGTDLLSRLQTLHVDTVFVAGVSTSNDILATVEDAWQCGVSAIAIREAVADHSESAHAQALADIENICGGLLSLSEAIRYLRNLPFSPMSLFITPR